jgi:hypothetical protein
MKLGHLLSISFCKPPNAGLVIISAQAKKLTDLTQYKVSLRNQLRFSGS